ncbi:MAG: c-5 sterol desaturase [Sarea resinae]|nr:MAG: c-5 sterol desaturase [Sarea resinae]
MDIVLEVLDTFFFDRVYATLLPASSATVVANSFKDGAANATVTGPIPQNYQYHPSTEYFQLKPSQWAYMSAWPRDNIVRQSVSLYFITWFFGLVVYFVCATASYVFVFDKTTFYHPKFLKHQIRKEIKQTMISMPIMAIFTVPFFVAEIRGYAKLYDTTEQGPGLWYNYFQFPLFIAFTDFCIYWIHRWLHWPGVYKALHKPHHKWIMPSPFASHAFHPLDGWSQSVPYHVFPFIFPLQKFAYVVLFGFINIWTVLIHDGEYVAESPIVNGAACHTLHHLYFNYNYGQFTTLWDRLGGSYRKPNDELFRKETKMGQKEWERQVAEMERIVKEVEGEDDRQYSSQGVAAKKVQ